MYDLPLSAPADPAPPFEGDRAAVAAFLSRHADLDYVYVLCRPDGRPFYVGIGCRHRLFAHESEARQHHPIETNPFKCNVIRKIMRSGGALTYRIDSLWPREARAALHARETELIAYYGRLHEGGSLTNLAPGAGGTGLAPQSRDKHAATLSGVPEDNVERAVLNRFLQSIAPVDSVPVKPASQIARILPTTPHPSARRPTRRAACALVASAAAHGRPLVGGVVIPRCFLFEGVRGVIENGVSRDLVKAGLATLVPAADPSDEAFALDGGQCAAIAELLGREKLEGLGLI